MLDALGGDKSKLVIDLSCRKRGDKWIVAMNRWQMLTDMEVNQGKSKPAHPATFYPPSPHNRFTCIPLLANDE